MNPPMPPIATSGAMPAIASSGEAAPKKRFHVHAALATQSSTRIPVLFTAPEMVIPSPRARSPVRNVSWPSAGFEVLINCGIQSSPYFILLDEGDGFWDARAHCTGWVETRRQVTRISQQTSLEPNLQSKCL